MTVADLKDLLDNYDDDAQVLLMTQSSWPFENAVDGACSREEMADGVGENDEDVDSSDREDDRGKIRSSDVFLVEGSQLRYGSKAAWGAC